MLGSLIIYSVLGIFVWRPIVGDARFYIYEDLRQIIAWVIVCFWVTISYYGGLKVWWKTICVHLFNYWIFFGFLDSINIAMVYTKHFPSQSLGNEELNDGLMYIDLFTCSSVYVVVNLIVFCLIMPNVPNWLKK